VEEDGRAVSSISSRPRLDHNVHKSFRLARALYQGTLLGRANGMRADGYLGLQDEEMVDLANIRMLS